MSLTPSPCDERELADLVLAAKRARDDEPDVALLEHVARAVAHAGLGARVRGAAEAERVLVVVRGLLRVADPELDVVPAVERHEVVGSSTAESTPVAPRSPAGHCDAASVARERSSDHRARIATPPTISQRVRCSPRSSSAKRTAKNGCRFANSDARDGPTRPIAVNQRMFVEEERPDHREGEAEPHQRAEVEALLRRLRQPGERERDPADASTSELIRNGE